MLRLGFLSYWVEKIIKCNSLVLFLLFVNGVNSDSFSPMRGLRQGFSLSPYLFITVLQGSSFLILSKGSPVVHSSSSLKGRM